MELVYIFAGIGITFNFIGCLGILRFPDVYTRMHAATKCTTFGTLFIGASIVLYSILNWGTPSTIMVSHTIVAAAALLLTNPTSAHAIARAAHRSGVVPKPAVIDSYKGVGR